MSHSKGCKPPNYIPKKIRGSDVHGALGKRFATLKENFTPDSGKGMKERFRAYKTLERTNIPHAIIKIKIYDPITHAPLGYSSEKLRLLNKKDYKNPKIINQFVNILSIAFKKGKTLDLYIKNFGIDKGGTLKYLDFETGNMHKEYKNSVYDDYLLAELNYYSNKGHIKCEKPQEQIDFFLGVREKYLKFKLEYLANKHI